MKNAPVVYLDRKGAEKRSEMLDFFRQLSCGRISVKTPVRYEDEPEFLPLETHPELSEALPQLELELRKKEKDTGFFSLLALPFYGLGFFAFLYLAPLCWVMFVPFLILLAPFLLISFLPGRLLRCRSLLLGIPYLNWVVAPLYFHRRYRGKIRAILLTGWMAYIALILILWTVPETSSFFLPAIFAAAFSLLLCLDLVNRAVKRKRRRRLAAIRIATGLRRPRQAWYKPGPSIPDPLFLPRLRHDWKLILRGIFQLCFTVFIPATIYLLVLYGVGTLHLARVERKLQEAGYSADLTGATPAELRIAAFFDTLNFIEPPEKIEKAINYGPYINLADAVAPGYLAEIQNFVAANQTVLERVPELLALLPARLPAEEEEAAKEEHSRKYRMLRELLDARYALMPEEERIARYPEFLDILRTMAELNPYFSLQNPAFAAPYLPIAPEPFLRRELAFWQREEALLPDRVRRHIWRERLSFIDIFEEYFKKNLLFFYLLQKKAGLLEYSFVSLREVEEYYLSPEKGQKKQSIRIDIRFLLMRTAELDNRLFSNGLARCRTTQAGTAAELYRRKYGEYPDFLEQLVPEFLSVVPHDPFTGKPLFYRKGELEYQRREIVKEGDSFTSIRETAVRSGIRIYSVGADGFDNHGRDWGPREAGVDISFTLFNRETP